ncbi:MAG TPA: GNAT family N-acetyltransferase [Longimicrobium sp.]|jgi:predicted acetyltransferase
MPTGEPLPAGVEVVRAAAEHEPVLGNLLELYAHDFSEFVDVQLRPDGRFGHNGLSVYWTEETRFPFLVKVNGHLAGFVFVSKGSLVSGDPRVYDMAEFFIVRGYRGRRIGTAVAHETWRRFPGPWEVRVLEANRPALAFWRAAIDAFTGGLVEPASMELHGKPWQVFSFTSPGG